MAPDRQQVFLSGAIGVTGNEHIHFGMQVARDGLLWPLYDWLVMVEASVKNHRHVCELGKVLNDCVKSRVRASTNRLNTRRSIEMYRSRY